MPTTIDKDSMGLFAHRMYMELADIMESDIPEPEFVDVAALVSTIGILTCNMLGKQTDSNEVRRLAAIGLLEAAHHVLTNTPAPEVIDPLELN